MWSDVNPNAGDLLLITTTISAFAAQHVNANETVKHNFNNFISNNSPIKIQNLQQHCTSLLEIYLKN